MPVHWGCDSCDRADSSYGGTTLANYVKNSYFVPDSIIFYGRYFSPTPPCSGYDTDATGESGALKSAGFQFVLPISSPGGVSSTGNATVDYNRGHANGNAFCLAIVNAIAHSSGKLAMPTANELFVFLDVEGGITLSPNYWNGWSTAVTNYSYNGLIPFYEACYCDPVDGTSTCSTLRAATGTDTCWGIWSNEPEPICGGCYSPGPSWGPSNCGGNVPTWIWQTGEASSCKKYCFSNFPPVDLDEASSAPGIGGATTVVYNMLRLP